MAYVGTVNYPVTTATGAAEILHVIKSALLAAGWELLASSNGTTYTAGASPDRVPDVTAWNNASAWCRLREPGGVGGREYCFMRGSSTISAIWKYSRATGFVGGSPNATTMPTTGAGGDGVVWLASSNTGFGNESLVTTTAYSQSIIGASPTGYVSCVASNTAVNGVYGWWYMHWLAGTGAVQEMACTEGVQVNTTPSSDADPSWRSFGGSATPWVGGPVSYWQVYDFTAPISPNRSYIINTGGFGFWSGINSGGAGTSVITPRTNIGFGPYGSAVQTYPVMVGSTAAYPKGLATGFCCYSVTLNNLDTLNLTTAEPRVVMNGTYGLALPWVPNVLPIF